MIYHQCLRFNPKSLANMVRSTTKTESKRPKNENPRNSPRAPPSSLTIDSNGKMSSSSSFTRSVLAYQRRTSPEDICEGAAAPDFASEYCLYLHGKEHPVCLTISPLYWKDSSK